MAKRTIEVPEGYEDFADAVEKVLREAMGFEQAAKKLEVPVDFAGTQRRLDDASAAARLAVSRRLLQGLDVDAAHVLVDGKRHARVGRYEAEYFTKEGPVKVTRSLYRESGKRNAKTVDAVGLRCGSVNNWLPEAAKAAAFLLQQGTSREAEATCRALGVFPYSRSSFERVGHEVGELHAVVRDEVESKLMDSFEVPLGTTSISVSLDRVAVPMEEPRARPKGRPKKGAPQRPVARVWHMAFAGTLTMHDAHGESLHTIRYGRMPGLGSADLMASLVEDAVAVLTKSPRLRVVLLSDGAKEMEDTLDRTFNRETLGIEVLRLVDFWHVVEKLAPAAIVVHGEAAPDTLQRWRLLLLNSPNAATRIRNELYASNKQHIRVGQEKPVHAAITYLRNQAPRMGYVAARAAGLPIGSGNVEATCKSLIGQRLVRSGSRWKESTGQHVIDLRALALSGRFHAALDLTLAPLVRQVALAA